MKYDYIKCQKFWMIFYKYLFLCQSDLQFFALSGKAIAVISTWEMKIGTDCLQTFPFLRLLKNLFFVILFLFLRQWDIDWKIWFRSCFMLAGTTPSEPSSWTPFVFFSETAPHIWSCETGSGGGSTQKSNLCFRYFLQMTFLNRFN